MTCSYCWEVMNKLLKIRLHGELISSKGYQKVNEKTFNVSKVLLIEKIPFSSRLLGMDVCPPTDAKMKWRSIRKIQFRIWVTRLKSSITSGGLKTKGWWKGQGTHLQNEKVFQNESISADFKICWCEFSNKRTVIHFIERSHFCKMSDPFQKVRGLPSKLKC